MAEDKRATLILDRMLKGGDTTVLDRLIRDRPVIVFGCGPSLENDLNKIWEAELHKRFVLVAVDGAVKALLEYNIVPHVNVTDLDGDLNSIVKANQQGCITVVHAHSENIRTLVKIIPYLKGTVIGTTHSAPTSKIHNFGGFTDGDRAVYIVEHFKPYFIALAGMDFGHVIGVYSGTYDPVKKPRGLREGKKLIEYLAAHTKVKIFNLTSGGEIIHNTQLVTVDKLKHIML